MKEKLAQEWFERGKKDFEGAKVLFIQRNFEVAIFLIHQALEKYLKGFLIFNGWKLRRIHNIKMLLEEAGRYNEFFMEFLNFGRKLTAFYYEERYPPGPIPEVSEEEAKEIVEKAEKIIELIKKDTGL